MKKILLMGIISVLIAAAIFSGCTQNETGTLVLKITDAPSDLNITHVNITTSQIQVHMSAAGGNNTTVGWTTVVNESQSFDLIALLNVTEFFGNATLNIGKYEQILLTIEACNITVNGTRYNCTVPSGAIKLIKTFELKADQKTTLIMDFDAQESISETGNHTYKFQPVIKVIQE